MALPLVYSSNTGVESANTTSHAVPLPATVVAGQLLIVWMSFDGVPGVTWDNSTAGTWSNYIDTANGTSCKLVVKAKIADGTEGGKTLTITTDATEQSVNRSIAVYNWEGTLAGGLNIPAAATGTTANPDPPAATDSWGTVDRKTIAVQGCDGGRTTSAYPSGFTLNQFNDSSGGGAGCGLGSAGLNNNAGSQNPGTFTISASDQWVAATISIRGGTAGLPTIPVNQVTETELSQSMTIRRTYTLVQSVESEVSQGITARRVYAVVQVTDTHSAQPFTQNPLRRLLAQVVETQTAQLINRVKAALLAGSSETDTAQIINALLTHTVNPVFETDVAQIITALKALALAPVVETDLAQAITGSKIAMVIAATETEEAQSITPAGKLGIATETNLAQSVTSRKTVTLVQATESEFAHALAFRQLLGTAFETDTAFQITRFGNVFIVPVAQVLETEEALTILVNQYPLREIGVLNNTVTMSTPTVKSLVSNQSRLVNLVIQL